MKDEITEVQDCKSLPVEDLDREFFESVRLEEVPKVVCLLEREPLNVNWRNPDDQQRTALHVATELGNSILVALLLGKGADVGIRDAKGKSPLNIALETNHKEILPLLANKTLSSLEECRKKQKLLMEESSQKRRGSIDFRFKHDEMKVLLKNADNSRSHLNQLDDQLGQISNQLNKMFEHPKSNSIFQTHFPRNSPITDMLKITHFQTIYNIFVAVLIISLVNTLLNNYREGGKLLEGALLYWVFDRIEHAVCFWLVLWCCSFSLVILEKGIVQQFITPRTAYITYIIIQVAYFIGVPKWVRYFHYPPATAAFLMCETVRLCMKMHSYLMVNRALRQSSVDDDPYVKEYPGNVTFSNYFMYLWMPTLIYQTSYPRTERCDWGFVLTRLSETAMCVLYIYAIFDRYCLPSLHEMQYDYVSIVFGIFKLMLPGISVSIIAFYMILHSWMNAFAEITRFADRHFYSDWWNSTDWATYYRRWNFVVHNFIHRHVFMECLVTFRMSKMNAMCITFLISAIIHEYIIAFSLGFYKPILFIMFLIPGVLFIPLTKLFKGSRGWNVFMWVMLIIGHGMLVGLYSRAWHFHYIDTEHPQSWYSMFWIL